MRTDLIKPLPVALLENATRFPGKVAFEDDRRAVTYGDLETRTRRLAGHLAGLGVRRGDRVAICLGNTVSTVESYLAIVRAGAVGVPLNPASALAELEYLLADSGTTLVITDPARAARLRGSSALAPGVGLMVTGDAGAGTETGAAGAGAGPARAGTHSYDELAATEPDVPARDDLGLDDVTWMFYTSGTTGRPKGVLSTQRNCLWSVASCYVPVPGLTPDDRVLWPLPLFHSLSHIACVLSVTVVGATARIVDGSSAEDVIRILGEDDPTFLAGVPTTYHHLVRAARETGFSAPALRIGLVGGAVTGPGLRRDFEETFGVPLVDAYGSTETCGAITVNPPDGPRVDGSCGLPVPGVGVRVVDPATGLDVPAGQDGEVWVSGPNVMAGYHNSPEATAAAVRDGWYRTGDLARRDEAGYFTIRGRIRELVIRGGENIHPEEIEAVLRTVDGVADVAVAGVPHDTLGEVPAAYVVPGPAGFDVAALISRCRERLSAHKVPDQVHEVTRVPRTASGKTQRRLLAGRPSRLRYAASGRHDAFMSVDWVPVPTATVAVDSPARPGWWAVAGPLSLEAPDGGAGSDVRHYPDLAAVRAALAGGGPAPGLVVVRPSSAAADDRGPFAEGRDNARVLADDLRVWSASPETAASRLVVLTRGAVVATEGDRAQDVAEAPAWGVVRSLQEGARPGSLTLLDLDTGEDLNAAVLSAVLASGEPQVAIRAGALLAPRLTRLPVTDEPRPRPWPGAAGTVVVTGADTERGAALAHRLATVHRAEALLLVGSCGSTGAASDAVRAPAGTDIVRVTADGGDPGPLRAALAGLRRPVTAVVHTADDPGLALLLDEWTAGEALAAFVVVSGTAGLLGAPEDPDTAVDAVLSDAVVSNRRLRNLPASFVAWGAPARGPGDATDDETAQRSRSLLLSAFDIALTTHPASLVALVPGAPTPQGPHASALLRGLADTPPPRARPDEAVTAALRDRLAGLDERAQLALLEDLVRTQAGEVLRQPEPGLIPSDRAFRDLGFTSLAVVALRDRLTEKTGLRLPTTVVFDHPTPAALAACLRVELQGTPVPGPVPGPAVTADPGEPVAVVGMACRLPGGVAGPEDLWRLVREGRDAVSGFPEDRGWDLEGLFDPDPDRPGTSYASEGGFLHEAGLFDAGFFGISPREALAMDPQQRLLLETSWEALEAAGVDPLSLKGTDTGVFTGAFGQGYGAGAGVVVPEVEGFASTGSAGSVASGRVSYVFGLEGPAVTVDTACSSSLVAMHLAAQSLRQGECSMALAGGVTVMATPGAFVEFSRQRGLAADGRCKAYADGADGTGWAEGVGVVVLERLSVARERGHRVLAVLRGSAVNQDGASNGLTAPNGPSQRRVIRRALASAGLSPSDVDVVEGHGTGTVLGDPIEAQALLATYGQGRDPERPLWLGSLKSNIGHTQAAAGVAGVIKMVQALRHGVLPATLHVDEPTTQVDWSAGAVELLTEAREWVRGDRPRRAGVSSFGVSGTNAHLILEEAPAEEPGPSRMPVGVVPLVVSARSAGSLAGQAGRLASWLESDAGGVPLAGVAGVLVAGRAVLDRRAVVVAGSGEEALAGLGVLARGESGPSLVCGGVVGSGVLGGTVWVFPGQGSQWVGMGRELLDSSPVFAERVQECAAVLGRWVDWSLVDVLRGECDPGLLGRVDVVQPVSFAVMVGLAAVWGSVGVRPDAVVGHSQGEIAAACVAGVLSLEDAVRVVVLRSRVIAARLSGHGGMASVGLGEGEVAGRLERWAGRVEVAAVNGPSSVVLAGEAEALDEALEALGDQGVRVRRVAVDYASHTRHVEDIRDTLAEALAGVTAQAPTVPFYSTVTGDWVEDAGVLDGGYWYRNLRRQVRFGPAVQDLLDAGHKVFVEVSAHPVLIQPITEIIDGAQADVLVTGSLRRGEGGLRRLLASMAELFVRGVAVDWAAVLPAGATVARVDLPTYAFDHQHYWLRMTPPATDMASVGLAGAGHPLLGAVVRLPQSDGLVFTSRLSLRSHPWLADHRVGGVALVPGTGLVELAVRAGDEAGCGVLEELVIEAPLVVPERGGVRVQVAVGGPGESGARTVEVYSLREDAADEEDAGAWTRHATGMAATVVRPAGRDTGFDFTAWPPPGAQPVDIGGGYDLLAEGGYGYGPAFRGVRAVWQRGDETFAEVALPEREREEAAGYGIHPALLDAALHTTLLHAVSAVGAPDGDDDGAPGDGLELRLPFAWNGLELHAAGASALRVRVGRPEPDALSLEAVDEAGGLVVTMDSLVGRAVSTEQLETAAATHTGSLFRVDWTELPPVRGSSPSWVPVATAEEVATLADDVLSGADAPAWAVLKAAGDGDAEGTVLALAVQALDVVQCWLAGAGLEDSRLMVVTRGAVPAGGDGTVTDPAGAAVWGLVRAAQAEHPDRIVLLDTDPAAEEREVESILGAALAAGEPQLAVRGTTLFVPRLTRAAATARTPDTALPVFGSKEGTVLVSGAGSLGALAARHLVTRHGVRHLTLASRRGPDAGGVAELTAELAAHGAAVSVVACDLSDRDQVRALLSSIPDEHPLTGVVHTAGVTDDGVIGALTPERLARVFAPKVDAVRHLDELTRGLDLDVFVVYSSVSAVFMGAGSGSYAAANAYLDGLMANRRAAGLPGLSLAWGLWEQTTGMAAGTDELTRARMNRRGGLLAMTPAEGMELFDAAVDSGQTLLVPAKLDLRTLRGRAAAGGGVPPLLRGLVRVGRQQAHAQGGGDEHHRLPERLAGLSAAEQTKILLDMVRSQVTAVLGHGATYHLDADQGLFEIGFDSLTAIELRNRLRDITERKLSPSLVFDCPTPALLAAHLQELMGAEQPPSPLAMSV